MLVRKEKVADTTNTTTTLTASPVAALAMGVGDAENDVNFSGISPPSPGTFVEPFPLACHSGFHIVTAGSKVGITPHWFVRFLSIRNTVSLTIQTTGQLLRTPSTANICAIRKWRHSCWLSSIIVSAMLLVSFIYALRVMPNREPRWPVLVSSPNWKKQRTFHHSTRLFAVCSVPPPHQPIFAAPNQGSTSTGTVSQPISVTSSPVVDGGNPSALSPSPIISRSRPQILCADSDSNDEGYSAAHLLAPLPAPLTTVDPRVLFAFNAVDSGDDGAGGNKDDNEESDDTGLNEQETKNVDSEKEGNRVVGTSNDSDSAITISDDDSEGNRVVGARNNSDSAITISDDDSDNIDIISISNDDDEASHAINALIPPSTSSDGTPWMAATPANPNALSSSHIVEAGFAGEESSSHVIDDSNSDWGFPDIDDPAMLHAIGHALDDPFGWGAKDGWD